MLKTIRMGIFASVFSMLAIGANLSGSLLDDACYSTQKENSNCQATASTTTFAIMASGKVYKLDATGNEKAAAAMKSRADRSSDPTKAAKADVVMAKVSGTVTGDTIQVESISVQ